MHARLLAAALWALALGSAGATEREVTYLPSEQVKTAFAKGTPLLEADNYKVHASRRETPGQAEIHERDTDVIYVLEGEASFVTGGKALQTKTVAPEEVRGSAIEGGETRRLVPGDVIVVPNGTAHWFREVKAPLLYYVVKVRAERKD